VRLFDRLPKRAARSYVAPQAEVIALGQYRLLPVHNIYASDEMSAKSEVMQRRISAPVLTLSADDANTLNIKNGQMLTVAAGQDSVTLPVNIVDYMPPAMIGYPVGQAPVLDMAQPLSVTVATLAVGV
jgi:NADH-quinone oxidoreductase subunit G